MIPGEFITFAKALADNPQSGASGYRSAVSRAYYGAYLSVSAMIAELAVPSRLRDYSEHKVIQIYLQNCQVPAAVQLGVFLASLHELRKNADYDMDDKTLEDQSESQLCVERANEIMKRLHKCRSEKSKIKAGILQYRKKVNA